MVFPLPPTYPHWKHNLEEYRERDGEENPPRGFIPAPQRECSGSADLDTSGGHLPGPVAEHEAVPCWWQGVVTHQVLAGHSLQLQGVEAGAPAGVAEDAVSPRPALGSWGGGKRAVSNELIRLIQLGAANSCLNPLSFYVPIHFRIGLIFNASKSRFIQRCELSNIKILAIYIFTTSESGPNPFTF